MTSTPASLILPSGLTLHDPSSRLSRFCAEEYAYYDGILDTEPDRVLPMDVLATIMVNSNILRVDSSNKSGFENDAEKLRRIHTALARLCDPWLQRIPPEADLRSFDPGLTLMKGLLEDAISVRGVGIAVATKTLHRKRPGLIPMLDSVVMKAYRDIAGLTVPDWKQGVGPEIASVAEVLELFRADLVAADQELTSLDRQLASAGFLLTPVRKLEILVWIEKERNGYYRRRKP